MASFTVNLLMINVGLKRVMWDSVHSELKGTLFFKVMAGNVSVVFGFSAIKYFPLSYCTVMRNISPFFAMVFSTVFLKEAPKLFQIVLLTIVTGLSLSIILPEYNTPDTSTATT